MFFHINNFRMRSMKNSLQATFRPTGYYQKSVKLIRRSFANNVVGDFFYIENKWNMLFFTKIEYLDCLVSIGILQFWKTIPLPLTTFDEKKLSQSHQPKSTLKQNPIYLSIYHGSNKNRELQKLSARYFIAFSSVRDQSADRNKCFAKEIKISQIPL